MQRSAQVQEIFHEGSVEADEISPSVTIRRSRRLSTGASIACNMVYTEQLWAPINNTLVGCAEFEDWQAAEQWILVADDSYNGMASAMLQGAETLTPDETDVVLVNPDGLIDSLLSMNARQSAVIVMAIEKQAIDFCSHQLNAWMQTCTNAQIENHQLHMIWLPTSRAEQTVPVHESLESLAWSSYTVLCDLANLPTKGDAVKESMLAMLRAAVFIDAQFMYWLEGNLSAMADFDEDLHQKAIMRAATSILTVKRRRSDEPAIPMAFTDTPALRYTQPNNEETPSWEVHARQLYIDVLYAQASGNFADAEVDRIRRVLDALNLLEAAEDKLLVTPILHELPVTIEPFVLLNELGTAIYTNELVPKAWETANK